MMMKRKAIAYCKDISRNVAIHLHPDGKQNMQSYIPIGELQQSLLHCSFQLIFIRSRRLELLPLSRNNKPELIFMDQIEEVAADVPYKNESSIQIKLKDNMQRIILYNQVIYS